MRGLTNLALHCSRGREVFALFGRIKYWLPSPWCVCFFSVTPHMPKVPTASTPKTPHTTIDSVGLQKSDYQKKDQCDANEAAIQAIALQFAPPKPPAQSRPCSAGGTCLGFVSIYTTKSAEVSSLDDRCASNFACWQQRVRFCVANTFPVCSWQGSVARVSLTTNFLGRTQGSSGFTR